MCLLVMSVSVYLLQKYVFLFNSLQKSLLFMYFCAGLSFVREVAGDRTLLVLAGPLGVGCASAAAVRLFPDRYLFMNE